jgi:ArsR family transcriptional regulator
MKPLYRMHAEFLKTVANPKRLAILDLLRNGRSSVTDLARAMELPLASVSQELAPLRTAGIVWTQREGKTVYYGLASPKAQRACDLMAEAMREVESGRASAMDDRGQRPEIFFPRSKQRA